MKLKIKVTEADIKKGIRASCAYCPVALAIKRVLQEKEITPIRIGVGVVRASVELDDDILLARIPDPGQDFIINFDRKVEVKPIEFELDFN